MPLFTPEVRKEIEIKGGDARIVNLIERKLEKGITHKEISDFLEVEISLVQDIARTLKNVK